MLISATGISDRQQGFSLLELLVVLFIIGMSSLLVMLVRGQDDQARLDQLARQLVEDLSYARELAFVRHHPVGWLVSDEGYGFALLQGGGDWQPYTSRALPRREWPQGVYLPDLQPQSTDQPLLVWLPAGEVTAGNIRLQLGEAHVVLQVMASGIEIIRGGDEPL